MADYDPRGLYSSKDLVQALSYKQVCTSVADSYDQNKLESVSIYQTIDAMCEGEIAGLCDKHGNLIKLTSNPDLNEDGFKGIYLNDVPVKNTDVNSLNYNRVFADFKVGTGRQSSLSKFKNKSLSFSNSVQTLSFNTSLPGLSSANKFIDRNKELLVIKEDKNQQDISEKADNASLAYEENFVVYAKNTNTVNQIRKAEKAQVISCIHVITNDIVNSVQVEMSVGALLNGQASPAGVAFVVKIGYVDDELTIDEGGSVIYTICSIYGITTAGYNRSHVFPLPSSGKEKRDRFIKIFRVDQERSVTDVSIQKSLSVASISEIVEKNLTYPHTALMGMIFDARAFSQPPTRRFDVKLSKVFVPSNYNSETKHYNGNWDGEFKPVKEWTDNPAWIFYDIATNERYGIGKFGFKSQYVDKWSLYSIAKYCDQFVPTGYSGKYSNLDFDCTEGSVTINVSAPSNDTSADNMLERFPVAGTICLFSTKNSNSTDLDKAFKRLIFYEKENLLDNYDSSSNKLKIKLVKIPDPDEVFEKYPDIKDLFLDQQKLQIENSYEYLINYLKTHTANDSDFANEYLSGEPLDLDVTSGKSSTQFLGYKPLLESRFRCNLYLDKKQDAYNVLNDIAAIFRGMIYWSSGYITASNDQSRDAVMLFTNSNVSDGQFVYSGSAATSRTTAVTVRFNDENDSYKPKVEYLEDPAGLREYGYVEKEVVALGITSRSQAHRLAKWILYTNQTETDTIQFTTGQEGSYLKPGDVVKIQDKLKNSKRYGGRIIDIDYGEKTITLDEGIQEDIVGEKITVIVPRANKTIRELNESAKSDLKNAVEIGNSPQGTPDSEVDSSREPQIKQFTIASVSETNVITITETEDEDFNSVLRGYVWSVQNTSSEYKIEEVEYRVLGVTEENFAKYQVTGMMYNRSKFTAVDESKSVENTQQSESTMVEVGGLPEPLTGDGSEISIGDLIVLQPNSTAPYFDAKFPNIQPNNENYYVTINFEQLALENSVNFQNTGGYVVEVTKASGDKIRFSLSGHDQTKATILIGDIKSKNDLTIEIYRFDTSFKIDVGL